jgi:type IV pilus assembly protein PilN
MRFVRWFGRAGLAGAGMALALAGTVWMKIEWDIARDAETIRLLKSEVDKLEPQIADVAGMRHAIQGILERARIIESLQRDRYAVKLLEELARLRPAGTYLVSLQDKSDRITMTGYAASQRDAEALLQNVARSALFRNARLVETRSEEAAPQQAYPLRFAIEMSRRLKEAGR